MEIVIIHYNTPELTAELVKSLNKNTPDLHINVFDNSDISPFAARFHNVSVFDNTHGDLVDFDRAIASYADKETDTFSGFGSTKHAMSVDYMMNELRKPFLLIDSDCIVKKDISGLEDDISAAVGLVESYNGGVRLSPVLLYINTPMLQGISFHDFNRMHETNPEYPSDTGGSILQDITSAGLPIRLKNIYDYVYHLGNGSFHRTSGEITAFIRRHTNQTTMLPKKIHTFWLSGEAIPEAAARNIETWRTHNPGYEVVVHGRDEFQELESTCEFYRTMLRDRRWCFAADYLRSKVLLAEGGWYTDADARCHKPLDGIATVYGERPRYLCKEAPNGIWIECGVMGFAPGDDIMAAMVRWYEQWREGDEFPVMPIVMERVTAANGIDPGPLLPDEALSGKRCPNMVVTDKKTGKPRVMIVVEPTELSFATHHFSHSGY